MAMMHGIDASFLASRYLLNINAKIAAAAAGRMVCIPSPAACIAALVDVPLKTWLSSAACMPGRSGTAGLQEPRPVH